MQRQPQNRRPLYDFMTAASERFLVFMQSMLEQNCLIKQTVDDLKLPSIDKTTWQETGQLTY